MGDITEVPLIINGIAFAVSWNICPDENDPIKEWNVPIGQAEIRVSACLPTERRRRISFIAAVDMIQRVVPHDRRIPAEWLMAYGSTIYGTLSANPGGLAFVTGQAHEMPAKVDVCGSAWTAEYAPLIGRGWFALGTATVRKQRIHIDPLVDEQFRRRVFLHEWCHAVGDALSEPLCGNEAVTGAMGYLLTDVLCRNPEWTEYWFPATKTGEEGGQT